MAVLEGAILAYGQTAQLMRRVSSCLQLMLKDASDNNHAEASKKVPVVQPNVSKEPSGWPEVGDSFLCCTRLR